MIKAELHVADLALLQVSKKREQNNTYNILRLIAFKMKNSIRDMSHQNLYMISFLIRVYSIVTFPKVLWGLQTEVNSKNDTYTCGNNAIIMQLYIQ